MLKNSLGVIIDHVDNVTGIGVENTPTVGLVLEDFNLNILGYTTLGVPNFSQIHTYTSTEFDNNYVFAGWLSDAITNQMSQIFTDPSGEIIGYGFPKIAGYVELDDINTTPICLILATKPAWGAYYPATDVNNGVFGYISATPTISLIDQLLDPLNKSIGWALPPTTVYNPLQTPIIGPFSIGSQTAGTGSYPITPPTSTSTGLWSYVSSNPAGAAISGSNIIPLVAGIVKVTATQAATPGFSSINTYAYFEVLAVPPTPTTTTLYDFDSAVVCRTYDSIPSTGVYVQLTDISSTSLGYIDTLPDPGFTVALDDPLNILIGYGLT